MAQTQMVTLGGSGAVPADTVATPNTLVMRDNSGNVANAQTAASELKTTGILTYAYSLKSANFTLDTSANVFGVDATSGAKTATLPSAVGIAGRVYTITKVDASANAVTVSGGIIANSLATQGASSRWISDGTNWQKIG